MPPPGDIRNCLVALAEDESLLATLFQHRFTRGDLAGHSLGNLFLAALTEVVGSFDAAVALSSRVLAIAGRGLPATPAPGRAGGRDGGRPRRRRRDRRGQRPQPRAPAAPGARRDAARATRTAVDAPCARPT